MVEVSLMEVVREVSDDPRIANHEKNKNIVRRLEEKGVFDIKGAVRVVADHLKLSKFTVYSYLREYRDQAR
jgi:predicted transcriptional regulator YheO